VFCSKCGAALTADRTFCGSCGTRVSPQVMATPAPVPVGVATVPPSAPISTYSPVTLTRTPTYAGFWLRFLSWLIDGLILSPIFVLFVFLGLGMTGGLAHLIALSQRQGGEVDPAAFATLFSMFFTFAALALLVRWLYFAYFESGEKQATWGKQVLGLYVTDIQGQRLSFGHASGRFFAKIVSNLIPLELGYIMAAFTEKRQALHDLIASTLVLKH
jgi:uncharacterized RDD family membrane protein YckC